MKISLLIWSLYGLGGVLMFFYFDHKNMNQEIPYGSVPDVAPLRMLRFYAFVLFLFFWLPAIATAFVGVCRDEFKWYRAYKRRQRELKDLERRVERMSTAMLEGKRIP